MAELISVSLDGYIEDRRQDIGWMTDDTSFDQMATATLRSIDGMIFGRKAHELLANFWPEAADSKGASPALIEQARLMNALPKYVLTHGKERTGWANSTVIGVDDVPRLKREAARPIALFAGASAAQVLLGGGTPLFAEDDGRRHLVLLDTERFESGAMFQRYRFR